MALTCFPKRIRDSVINSTDFVEPIQSHTVYK